MTKRNTKKPEPIVTIPPLTEIDMVTQQFINDVEELAGIGLTMGQIKAYFKMTQHHWDALCATYPVLKEAIACGKAKTLKYVGGKLREKIDEGNLSAIIFYLKAQGLWRETGPSGDADGNGERPPFPAMTLAINDPVEAAKIYQQVMIGS